MNIETIKLVLVVMVPCSAIYAFFRFNSLQKISNVIERWATEQASKPTEPRNNAQPDKPTLRTFMWAWLLPLSMLTAYKYFYDRAELTLSLFSAYLILFAVVAVCEYLVALYSYRKKNRSAQLSSKGYIGNE